MDPLVSEPCTLNTAQWTGVISISSQINQSNVTCRRKHFIIIIYRYVSSSWRQLFSFQNAVANVYPTKIPFTSIKFRLAWQFSIFHVQKYPSPCVSSDRWNKKPCWLAIFFLVTFILRAAYGNNDFLCVCLCSVCTIISKTTRAKEKTCAE